MDYSESKTQSDISFENQEIKREYEDQLKEKKKIFMSIKIRRNNNWSKEEDDKLLYIASTQKVKNWLAASQYIKTKNPSQCSARYKRIRPGLIKGPWSKDDDALILQLVSSHGKNWTEISKFIPSRNSKQIRDRYLNYLDRTFKKEKFTDEEDKLLIAKYLELGSKWSRISEFFNGRTGDMIKNRFYSCLKKKVHVFDIKPHKKILKNYYKLKKEKLRLQAEKQKQLEEEALTKQQDCNNIYKIKIEDNGNKSINLQSILKQRDFNYVSFLIDKLSDSVTKTNNPEIIRFIEALKHIDMIRNEEIQRLVSCNGDIVSNIERILKDGELENSVRPVVPGDNSMNITINVNNPNTNDSNGANTNLNTDLQNSNIINLRLQNPYFNLVSQDQSKNPSQGLTFNSQAFAVNPGQISFQNGLNNGNIMGCMQGTPFTNVVPGSHLTPQFFPGMLNSNMSSLPNFNNMPNLSNFFNQFHQFYMSFIDNLIQSKLLSNTSTPQSFSNSTNSNYNPISDGSTGFLKNEFQENFGRAPFDFHPCQQ